MLPPKSDPRWVEVIKNIKNYNFTNLPTKMLMMRIYLIALDGTSQKIQLAIDIAHEFFSKNQNVVMDDIKILFGSRTQ